MEFAFYCWRRGIKEIYIYIHAHTQTHKNNKNNIPSDHTGNLRNGDQKQNGI